MNTLGVPVLECLPLIFILKNSQHNPCGGLRSALTISHATCCVENRVTLLNPPYTPEIKRLAVEFAKLLNRT